MSYDPETAMWREQDLAGYVDGANLYEFVRDNPASYLDPLGLGSFDFSSPDTGFNNGTITKQITLSTGDAATIIVTWNSMAGVVPGTPVATVTADLKLTPATTIPCTNPSKTVTWTSFVYITFDNEHLISQQDFGRIINGEMQEHNPHFHPNDPFGVPFYDPFQSYVPDMAGAGSLSNPFSDSPGFFGNAYNGVRRGIGVSKNFHTYAHVDGVKVLEMDWHFHGYTFMPRSSSVWGTINY